MNKLNEYAEGLNHYIRQGEEVVEMLRNVKHALDEARHARENVYLHESRQMREEFTMLVKNLERMGMPAIDAYGYRLEQLAALINGPKWPVAIDPDYIAITDENKRFNACQILDLFVIEYLQGLKFLDFGCGGGFVAEEAAKRKTAMAVGYDIAAEWKCPPADNFLLTTDLGKVWEHAPFDIILMNDVLDHCEKPVEALSQARDLLSARGKIYVRNHPWCSKHGGHLYEHVNKAYAHIIFDEVEQMRLFGRSMPFVHKLTHPLRTYKEWFSLAGLEVRSENPLREPSVPDFFANADETHIQDRLMKHWKYGDSSLNLSLSFVHYVLESSQSNKHIL